MTRPLLWRIAKYTSLGLGAGALAIAWATLVVAESYIPEPERKAVQICRINGGNHLMQLAGLPSEMLGWRCYNFKFPDADPDWMGPDILAREYLPYEKRTGWEIWEDSYDEKL